MKRYPPAENTPLVIAVSIAFFGALALLGWSAGVFAKLPADELAVLAGFVAGFAALTYGVDGRVRATLKRGVARFFNKPVASSGYPRGGSSRPGGFSRIE